jgi:hypothetical protein
MIVLQEGGLNLEKHPCTDNGMLIYWKGNTQLRSREFQEKLIMD